MAKIINCHQFPWIWHCKCYPSKRSIFITSNIILSILFCKLVTLVASGHFQIWHDITGTCSHTSFLQQQQKWSQSLEHHRFSWNKKKITVFYVSTDPPLYHLLTRKGTPSSVNNVGTVNCGGLLGFLESSKFGEINICAMWMNVGIF